jgi:hypothetical protein
MRRANWSRGMSKNGLGILSADDVRPYERPPLSKGFPAGKDAEASAFIESNDFYGEHGIDLHLRTHVTTPISPPSACSATTGASSVTNGC